MNQSRNVGFEKVKLTAGFWKEKQEMVRQRTIRTVYNRFAETGRIGAFSCDWKEGMDKKPHYFWDSDVAKWIEAVAYITETEKAPELEALADAVIDNLAAHQEPDGYFNIYFTVVEPGQRFKRRGCHELYCAGHLLEAAIAYKKATGKDKLYVCMLKYIDLIDRVFRVEKSAAFVTPGHEEIELALMKLYDDTGEKRYLELAEFFVDNRGRNADDRCTGESDPRSFQDQAPVREQTTAEGHAVRLCYLYSGVSDVVAATGDKELLAACERVFDNIINRRMYITGGIGSTAVGENFEDDWILPNETAYCETCAAISLAMFARRMQILSKNAKYADIVERVLYNGFLSGVSLDGNSFFYENPLEITRALRRRCNGGRTKIHYPLMQRVEVFECSCCPPNISRFIPSVSDMVYTVDGDTVRVNQFMQSEADFDGIRLEMLTDFPFSGNVTLRYKGKDGRIALRVPSWCKSYRLTKNGMTVEPDVKEGYAYVTVTCGDCILYNMEMKPFLVSANPLVADDAGRAALCFGPFVYCAEAVDNPEFHDGSRILKDIALSRNSRMTVQHDPALGLPVIDAEATCHKPSTELYSADGYETETKIVRFIPYHAFGNRGESDNIVWIREI